MHIEKEKLRTHYYYSPNPQRRQGPVQQPQHSPRITIAAVALVVLFASFIFIRSRLADRADANPQPAQVQAASTIKKPAKNVTSDAEMAAAINQVITASPDIDISVSITHLSTGKTYHYGLGVQFDEASIGKILTAINYLRRVEKGDLTLDQDVNGMSARKKIQLMIEQSDNVAWKNLNDLMTRDDLKAFAESLGITTYDPNRNVIDSNAIALLLAKFYSGKIVNSEHKQLLLGYLKNANRKDFILASIPQNIPAYHKAGWLEDRNHDAAIIDDGWDPYVLVIFTNGQRKYHPVDATTVIQHITQATVSRFIGIQPTSE